MCRPASTEAQGCQQSEYLFHGQTLTLHSATREPRFAHPRGLWHAWGMVSEGCRRTAKRSRAALSLGWSLFGCVPLVAACGGRAFSDTEGLPNSVPGSSPDEITSCADNPLIAPCDDDALAAPPPAQETCEDNPYLSQCQELPPPPLVRDTCDDNPYLRQCVPPTNWEEATLLLQSECGACHAPSESGAGPDFPFTEAGLEESGLVVRCAPERSELIRRLRNGTMPVTSAGYELLDRDVIDGLAALIEEGCPPPR